MENGISRRARLFLILWVTAFVVFTLILGYTQVYQLQQAKAQAVKRHNARLTSSTVEAGKTSAETSPPPGAEDLVPVEVRVGIYMDRIVGLSIREARWTPDFYIWFSWTDSSIETIEDFQVIDGEIKSKNKLDEFTEGDRHYELYRVTAQITKFFNISRFPCDDHLLTLKIEPSAYQSYQVKFVADEKGSNISSRVKSPGYEIYRMGVVVKPHSYKTSRGDPRLPVDFKATYSQFILGIGIARPDWGIYIKMFQGLFAAAAIAFLTLFVKPTAPSRFQLGVGALFATVANTYIIARLLPDTGEITLATVVTGLTLGMVFLIMVQSAISLYIFDVKGQKALSALFDKVTCIAFLVGYIAMNLAIPLAGSM